MKSCANKKGILAVIISILASYAIALNIFKVAASTSLIMANFGITSQKVGTLVSAAGLVGIILCLPAGALVTKFGPRKMGIIAVCSSLIGSVIGAFAPSFEILLISRLFEGLGFGCIATIIPPLITDNIDFKKRSIFMGFFSCFGGIGQIIMFSVANSLLDINTPATYTNLWIFTSICLGIILIAWILFVKTPQNNNLANKEKISITMAFKNPLVWIACLATFLTITGFNGGTTYTMSYCEYRNVDPLIANKLATIRSIAMIVSSIGAGIVISPFSTKKRCLILIISAIFILIAYNIMWRYTSPTQAIISMIIIGLSASAHPTILVSITPELSQNPKLTGLTNGFIAIGQNLGQISVGMITGRIIDGAGFEVLSWVYCIFGVVIIISSAIIYFAIKKDTQSKKINN